MVPLYLLLVEESGFIPTTSSDNLKKETDIRSLKTQKHTKKEENNEEDQADTRVVGTKTSRRTSPAWFRASIMLEIPRSRLSHSMLSA